MYNTKLVPCIKKVYLYPHYNFHAYDICHYYLSILKLDIVILFEVSRVFSMYSHGISARKAIVFSFGSKHPNFFSVPQIANIKYRGILHHASVSTMLDECSTDSRNLSTFFHLSPHHSSNIGPHVANTARSTAEIGRDVSGEWPKHAAASLDPGEICNRKSPPEVI